MKYQIKIEGQNFEVEIDDLHARPVMVLVNGDPVEVWPQNSAPTTAPAADDSKKPALNTPPNNNTVVPPASAPANNTKQVLSPIPGVIVSIGIQPGMEVTYGQELCVLEAMKMKNAIRATRAGRIETIFVTVGQQVNHHDVLMEYAAS